jgi:UDP-glucose 4-epimerase
MERTLHWYGNAHPLTWVTLRYFNAAGADPEGEIGEAHRPETHIIPLAISAAQGRAASLPIFGADYETPDGTAVRDYVHVNDLAQAHLLALHYLEKGGDSTAFNLGTGTGHSVRQIQHSVERIGKRRVPVIIRNRRPGDPPLLVANADKARRILGWQPEFTDIDDIIETAWYWHASKHPVMAEAL